jgi:hypothetical protein
VLWLAGYDSSPAVMLKDHCYCQLKVQVTTRNIEPLKSFEWFKRGCQPIDLISPQLAIKATQLLQAKSAQDLQENSKGVNDELQELVEEDFERYGYEIVNLCIEFRLSR